jgi:hypothetical protein
VLRGDKVSSNTMTRLDTEGMFRAYLEIHRITTTVDRDLPLHKVNGILLGSNGKHDPAQCCANSVYGSLTN